MATVYLCTDTKIGRSVAIKLLHPDLAAAVGGDRFHREIKIATGLTHPNILPAYDSGELDGKLFYVMPFVEGESLRERIHRERQLPVQDAVRITCEIASALHYAHSRGIIHRDIKPENILLESDHAVLADFGIARAITAAADVEALTQTGMSLGTPSYMSPEQAMGERNLDGRSDQYALACVTYEMLAGQPPFMANTMQALVAKHLGEPVPLISTVRPAVPDELEDVILQALEKVPADRFATMSEFADALSKVVATTGTWARRTPGRERTGQLRATRRHPALAATAKRRKLAIAAAVVLILLGGGGLSAWQWSRASASAASAVGGGFDGHRVAVLYFEDLSRNKELALLAAGLTESLIDQLNQVNALDVVSKNGVKPFQSAEIDIDSVAGVLKAGHVVYGSVEQTGAKIRVQTRLFDGNSGLELKGAHVDWPAGDLLVLRDSLAVKVAGLLRQRLGDEVRLREQREGTRSTDAWLLVQRAERLRDEAQDSTGTGNAAAATANLIHADSLLALAAKTDPAWAEPHIERGNIAYRRSLLARAPSDAKPLMDSALGHAAGALALSPNSPKALELRGTVRYQLANRGLEQVPAQAARLVREAEKDLQSAVTAEKSLASAWFTLSDLHLYNSDFLKANNAARRAYEEDAYLSSAPLILWQLFSTSYELEDFEGADRSCTDGVTRFPTHPLFVRCRLFVLTTPIKPVDPATAWRLAEEWRNLAPASTRELQGKRAHGLVAIMLARDSTLRDSALHVIERSRGTGAIDPDRMLFPYEAYVRLMRGERDEALRLLQQYLAVNPEIRSAMSKRYSWWWRDLAKDPRFIAMIESGR